MRFALYPLQEPLHEGGPGHKLVRQLRVDAKQVFEDTCSNQ